MKTKEEITKYKMEWQKQKRAKEKAASILPTDEQRCKHNARCEKYRNKRRSSGVVLTADQRKRKNELEKERRLRLKIQCPEKLRQYFSQYMKKRRQSDVSFDLKCRLRRIFNHALKATNAKKAGHTFDLIGCSPQFLKEYLESKFLPGMSWECRNKIHIDHIIPISRFDITDVDQQIKCFHYTNLQPLWAEDNLKKSNKYTSPAQRNFVAMDQSLLARCSTHLF